MTVDGSESAPGAGSGRALDVIVADEQSDVDVDTARWAALASAVLADEGCRGELTLTFVDRDEITGLNGQHMGGDGPTDVLSFPLDAPGSGPDDAAAGEPVLLGDVVICPAVAIESAPTHAGSLDDELALLVVHGILHVLGHDHADVNDAAVMRDRERYHLETHHWRRPAPSHFSFDHLDAN